MQDEYGKDLHISPLAETWECSTHPEGQSVVASGEDSGTLLGDVLKAHPEYIGTHPLQSMGGRPELPILIKLIDAGDNLSVQVHPDDEYASVHENSLGKTEMWYILSAHKGASVVYGFRQDMDAEKVKQVIKNGQIANYLNLIPVRKDDIFFIEAGMVHSIGAGIVLVEIQESSNLTYRLYDYGRLDRNGKLRALHVDKAIRVMNFKSSSGPRQPMRVFRYKRGSASELLTRCAYFLAEKLLLNTENYGKLMDFKTESNSFHVLLCTDGSGALFGQSVMLKFSKGDTVFVPADSIPLKLHGKAQLLDVSC